MNVTGIQLKCLLYPKNSPSHLHLNPDQSCTPLSRPQWTCQTHPPHKRSQMNQVPSQMIEIQPQWQLQLPKEDVAAPRDLKAIPLSSPNTMNTPMPKTMKIMNLTCSRIKKPKWPWKNELKFGCAVTQVLKKKSQYNVSFFCNGVGAEGSIQMIRGFSSTPDGLTSWPQQTHHNLPLPCPEVHVKGSPGLSPKATKSDSPHKFASSGFHHRFQGGSTLEQSISMLFDPMACKQKKIKKLQEENSCIQNDIHAIKCGKKACITEIQQKPTNKSWKIKFFRTSLKCIPSTYKTSLQVVSCLLPIILIHTDIINLRKKKPMTRRFETEKEQIRRGNKKNLQPSIVVPTDLARSLDDCNTVWSDLFLQICIKLDMVSSWQRELQTTKLLDSALFCNFWLPQPMTDSAHLYEISQQTSSLIKQTSSIIRISLQIPNSLSISSFTSAHPCSSSSVKTISITFPWLVTTSFLSSFFNIGFLPLLLINLVRIEDRFSIYHSHCKKNLLNCLQLTCRNSQKASVVTPSFLQDGCTKTSTYANMWSLNGSFDGACCMSTAGILLCTGYMQAMLNFLSMSSCLVKNVHHLLVGQLFLGPGTRVVSMYARSNQSRVGLSSKTIPTTGRHQSNAPFLSNYSILASFVRKKNHQTRNNNMEELKGK
ncbi:hypothetical protein VP01_34g5 [Puccinia sorghi]|uniref:Uncharacterized protein n=1 Tax=Puccinia sorghi TaxID=27349 RepID=A0A0L6UVN6_9BASI|nr:hypothetical protein VP01_34g5 [Puccinia sorghi]